MTIAKLISRAAGPTFCARGQGAAERESRRTVNLALYDATSELTTSWPVGVCEDDVELMLGA